MSSIREDLESFHRFATERLAGGDPALSLDELFVQWHDERPVTESIRQFGAVWPTLTQAAIVLPTNLCNRFADGSVLPKNEPSRPSHWLLRRTSSQSYPLPGGIALSADSSWPK